MVALTSAGELLRESRRRAGLTQHQLAGRAGVVQSVVSAYESGRRQPSVPVLLALLRAAGHELEVSLETATGQEPQPLGLAGPLGRRLRERRDEVLEVAARHGVDRVQVFGSVARGTEVPSSDVDLLVDLPAGAGLFALGRLRRELEHLLACSVDVVPSDALREHVRDEVTKDAVAL